MTSERAQDRQRDLRGLTLQRLKDHTELTDLLSEVVDSPTDVIVPRFTVRKWRNDNQAPDPPDAAIAVMMVTEFSDRRNRQEYVNQTVQVELEFRPGIKPSIGTLPWADAVGDEIEAVMTSHVEGWTAEGATGGTPEPLWNDERNRYVVAKRFDISRFG